MVNNDQDDQRHSLDDEQKIDARQALGCGLSVAQVARHFGLSEERFRSELGMPQWRQLPMDRQRTLFEIGGAE
jgi:hypothetical protein